MKVILSRDIKILMYREQWFEFELELLPYLLVDNNAYTTNLNLGISVKDIPQKFMLAEIRHINSLEIEIIIPIGMWDFINHLFKEEAVDDRRVITKRKNLESKYDFLYPYQGPAAAAMSQHTNGILKAPTGTGKTVMGILLGLSVGESFLWINDRIELAKQAMKTAINLFGLDPKDCGLLQGDNENISKYTFTTIQKLSKVLNKGFNNSDRKLTSFDTILIDECQHCVGSYNDYKEYFQVTRELDYHNIYGITATEDRVDGNEHLTFAIIGPVKHEVEDTSKKMIAKVINKRYKVETSEEVYESFVNRYTQKAMPAKVDAYLLFNEGYLEFCEKYINDAIKNYNKVAIISPRVAGAQYVSDYLKGKNVEHFLVHGTIRKREKMYTSKVLVATLDLIKEGFDVPDLEIVMVLARLPHRLIRTQIVGRAERYCEGKKDPVVYFLIPDMYRPHKKQSSIRDISLESLLLG